MDALALWRRYRDCLCECPIVGMTLDISRMNFADEFLREMEPAMQQAYEAMRKLEGGEIANPDETRMVGHYWLRAPHLAPDTKLTDDIERAIADVESFAADVHSKTVAPPTAPRFTELLMIGIGGSALGPQLVADALGTRRDRMNIHFLDNTDPDGIDRELDRLGARLKSTLVCVVSKSGGTKETRNGMLEVQRALKQKSLDFAKHAVAITGEGSELDQRATSEGWLQRFPMWDWVGGRTSVTSAVGLLPAALQGVDIRAFLTGAAAMDQTTRQAATKDNPAALLALMWHHATNGRSDKDMVILPYKDRLLLMSRYLQQLIMESLGKKHDLAGNVVHQGIAVYGNKGSTDQHAFVQQLRDGLNNFFVTFITVLTDRAPAKAKKAEEVEPGAMTGDFLLGFWQGTRAALYNAGRESITITLDKLDAHRLGALIALYERAVSFYASLININAYHQPGVEAGKKAAKDVLELQHEVIDFLRTQDKPLSVEQIADRMQQSQDVEAIHHILQHLAANKRSVKRSRNRYRTTS